MPLIKQSSLADSEKFLGWRARGSALGSFFVLWLVNFATFRKHYQGKSTFPWDFLGGYHAQAFGWYDLGSLASPPSWLPWSSLGFPAFLAIQAGGWYVPLALMHGLGIVYTVHAATMLQVLHVLFGALGAFVLARRLGAGTLIALLAAIAYHYQAAFFSNQQHVDIVRASAWFPWLLFTLHPKQFRGWAGPLAAAFVLSQLLIAGYPGAIVAFAYASAVWVLLLLWVKDFEGSRRRYLVQVTISTVSGVLMSMPKWMPFLLNGKSDITLQSLTVSTVDPAFLFTLIFPHDVSVLGGDQTMRSLWLPLAAFWGGAFASPRSQIVRLGSSLLLLGLVFCFGVPRFPSMIPWLPGISLSRFPLADWRPVISVGSLLISLAGWHRLFSREWSTLQVGLRTTVATALVLIATIYAIRFGYDAPSLVGVLGFMTAIAAITVIAHAASAHWRTPDGSRGYVLAVLLLCTALQGYWYQLAQPRTWRPAWNREAEVQSFGGRFKDFMRERHPDVIVARRPVRLLLGETPQVALARRDSSFYNRCWYMHTYCVFGYDNLRMSGPHTAFLTAVAGHGGDDLLRFVSRPQQLLILSDDNNDKVPSPLPGDHDAAVVGDARDVSIDFVEYGPGFTTYRIETPRALRVVENEIGWHGWKISRCDVKGACSDLTPVSMTSQALRTWRLPEGTWTVHLRFVGPSNVPGYLSALFGILLAAAAGIIWRDARRSGAGCQHV